MAEQLTHDFQANLNVKNPYVNQKQNNSVYQRIFNGNALNNKLSSTKKSLCQTQSYIRQLVFIK